MDPADADILDEFHIEPGWRSWLRSKVRTLINFTGATGMTLATGGHARWVAPFNVEFVERLMPLPGLGAGLAGFRLTQVTDLHTGGTPVRYLNSVIDRVNDLPCDLVVVTGDLVSSQLRWVGPACDVLARLRHRTLVTFGNHDYSTGHAPYISSIVADALQRELDARRIEVLRNRAVPIERAGSRAWIVGLEDYWSGKFSAETAFADVPAGQPVIALSHNPDTGPFLASFGAHWILAGHTHGGQIRLPGIRALMLPLRNKRFASGQFVVGKGACKALMYVSRGVGCRVPVRFRCPPEVTTFVFEMAPADNASAGHDRNQD